MAKPDLAQYLSVLPGVVFSGDQGGQLYIRGGSPIQNKILLDGLTIYKPFHSIGFYSVFETEAIRSVDVLTGGFNAEYGGRISAIVDIKTREGNKKRLSGIVFCKSFYSKSFVGGTHRSIERRNRGKHLFFANRKNIPIWMRLPNHYTNMRCRIPLDHCHLVLRICMEKCPLYLEEEAS